MALRLIIQRRLALTQGWPVCFGMPGRIGSEWVADLRRNTQPAITGKKHDYGDSGSIWIPAIG